MRWLKGTLRGPPRLRGRGVERDHRWGGGPVPIPVRIRPRSDLGGGKLSEIIDQALDQFISRFGTGAEVVVRAPGRVNLIGEHTDYNEGFVFPVAIDRWVVFAARVRPDSQAVIVSAAHGQEGRFATDRPVDSTGSWEDYPRGVLTEFQKAGHGISGFEAVLVGDVPVGAGLSSSAAVEMAVGKGLLDLNGIAMGGRDLALLGQRAENRFVGVNCGIMDQFVSANARAGHALLLDCRDLAYEQVPLSGEDVKIVICNSNVQRGLSGSAYNDRRAACEEGVRQLSGVLGRTFRALRDVVPGDLEAGRGVLPDEVYRRCRHVVGENERTRTAVECLRRDDLEGFGARMAASHDSLRDDYEVSSRELDLLVDIAGGVPGVLGARMTGAGFGGCTVNLVRDEAVAALADAVQARYPRETGLDPEVYVCSAVNGAERVM